MGKGWQAEGVGWIEFSLVSRILFLHNVTQLLRRFHGVVLFGTG